MNLFFVARDSCVFIPNCFGFKEKTPQFSMKVVYIILLKASFNFSEIAKIILPFCRLSNILNLNLYIQDLKKL